MGTCSRVFAPQGSSHSDKRVQQKNLIKMDIRNKDEFIIFMQRATEDTSNDCYIELYNILLRAFISADKDFDGKVDEGEFEGMISAAAAFPQKFGCEFWAGSGKDQFAAIDENGDGAVSFDEWLGFAYSHYKSQALDVAFDKLDKETFVKDCKNVGDTNSDAYRKIYWFSWKCFQAADADRDGQVSDTEFGTMINVATAAQKRLGLPAPYQTPEEQMGLFKKMDENGDGSISYDEWLACFLSEIIAPVAAA